MSARDTLKIYHPVTLVVGCGCVMFGILASVELLPGTPTVIGDIFILTLFVLLPISLGAAIIHNQLRLRRNSKQP
jgi:hypothetical protein